MDRVKQSPLIITIAISAALSGLLFGYDAGIISGALLFINQTFVLGADKEGWLVAMVPLGALLSSALSGNVSDTFGRKNTLFLTAIFFALGSLLCAYAMTVTTLMVGRLILGIAIGVGSAISPVYTSELANEKQRGWLVNLFVVFVQFGVFLSFAVSYLLSSSGNWRLMIGLGIFPAVILFITVFFLPESPRWLVINHEIQKARNILAKLYDDIAAQKCIVAIQTLIKEDQITLKQLFKQPRYFKVILIGIAVSFFTQTVGINAFNYYAPTIFQQTGFANVRTATFCTLFMGLTLTISTIGSLFFIDKIGRKKPLMIGTSGILIVLLAITWGFSSVSNPQLLGWLFLSCAIVFMILHGVSIGPACFLIPAEIFPLRVRGLAMGISVAFNWGANVIVAAIIPLMINHFGVASIFAMFLGITTIAWLVFYYYIPETKGTTLEQIEQNVLLNVRAVDLGKQTILKPISSQSTITELKENVL